MNTPLRNTLLSTALLALTCTPAVHAQMDSAPISDHGTAAPGKALASPAATATVSLAGKAVTIHYNTPSLRGRHLGGPQIVPWGQVWRTGANPATTLITTTALKIGTLEVPAGTYTLYTLPAAPGTPWQLIINKQTGQWGTEYHQEQDLGRTPLMSKSLAAPQEVMSISFDNVHGKSAELHIRWETTDEWIKVEAK
jgi:hypothetical protein